jgi:tetratricopeptide (TPR) repeat protein
VQLRIDQVTILTDGDWDVSYAGALRLPARLAEDGPDSVPGAAERTPLAFGHVWKYEGVFFGISLLAVWTLRRVAREKLSLTLLALSWFVLLAHNIRSLPFCLGFDASSHIDYIARIQSAGVLPRADQGWEMFQPPFYYILCAQLLRWWGCAAFSGTAMLVLRGFNLFVGAVNVALILVGLRMVFPGQRKQPLAGTALAAFLPCQFYLLHYTTNEILAATLGTASICLCLKCLHAESFTVRWHVGLGIALGVACWTKASAIALLPAVFVALAGRRIVQREHSPLAWMRTIGTVLVLVLAINGRHYGRMWSQFGSPLAGNWTPGVAAPWWQQPGYVTSRYFLSFGRSLLAPYYAGCHSFWDGLYATFWGDSLWGGQLTEARRTPWNYDYMTAGFVLALAPTFLIGTGAMVAIIRWVRQPRLDWLLLLGVPATFLFALAYMNLKLPYYGEAKAFYALPALLPVCVFAVVGYDFWASRSRSVGGIALALAGVWWINNYVAFWIQRDTTQTNLCRAMAEWGVPTGDPMPDFQQVLASDPHNPVAELYVALLDRRMARMDRFAADVKQAYSDHSDDGQICALAAESYARQGNWTAALPLAELAARLAPDDYAVALNWLRFARDNQRDADVVTAGELVLRDRPYQMETHLAMASALARLGQTKAAAMHSSIAAEGR